MPFPSGRCRTCRARHLKCDEVRPKCSRCQISNRECSWDDNDGNNVFFRDENAFASSKVKRQRGGARWSTPPKPRSPSSASASASAFERSVYPSAVLSSRRSSSQSIKSASNRHPSLSRCPSESLRDHALARLLRRYVCADSAMTAEIWGFIHDYQYDFFPLKDNTMLSYAIYALALNNYGQAAGYAEATTLSQEHYSHAVSMTGNAVRNALTTVDDELILTVMLLSAYEDFSGSFDPPTLTSRGFHHISGVTALLKLRRFQKDPATPRSQRLDQIVRRRIIRTSLYRGVEVPNYLQCSIVEEDLAFDLSLNSCLIDVASLRSQALALLNNLQSDTITSQSAYRDAIQALIHEATYVDARLKSWHAYLPPDWKPQIRTIPYSIFKDATPLGIFYAKQVSNGTPAGFDSDVCLNRYRAARLVVNSILAKTISHAGAALYAQLAGTISSISETESTIARLADEICSTVPYFFDCHPSSGREMPATLDELIDRMTVPRPMQLVWPLVVASTQETIPLQQRQWIRDKIRLIAKVAGSGTLEQIAGVDLHAHQGMLRTTTLGD